MSTRRRSKIGRPRSVTFAMSYPGARVALAAGLVLAALEGTARAQTPPPTPGATAEKTSEDADLEASRARFRKGMEAYTAGDFAGAIVVWQAIYGELGAERGYRLAFNLGRAHDAYGDAARATELYAAYLDEVGKRRARGEELPPLVVKQAEDAEARIAELVRTRGRLRIAASKAPVLVSIDGGTSRPCGFSALLPPGKHTLVFRTGDADVKREIEVREGEAIELVPPEPAPRELGPRIVPRPPVLEVRTVRPFSPVWIFVGAGATALAVLLPTFQYAHALSVASEHDASDDALARERLASEYSGARTAAYATMSVPIVLGVATLGMGAAFLLGTKNESVRVGTRGLGLEGRVTF